MFESNNIHNETIYKLSIFHLISMFLRNSKFIFKITGLFMFVALVYSLLAPPSYNSYMTILPLNGKQPNNVAAFVSFTSFGGVGADIAETIVGIIKSPAVLDKVINSKHLFVKENKSPTHIFRDIGRGHQPKIEEIRDELLGKMSVISDKNTGLITISVGEKTPERSVEMTKALFEATRTVVESLAMSSSYKTSSALESQIKIARDELTEAGKELLKYNARKAGTGKTPVDVRAVLDLQSQMIKKEMELHSAKTFGTKNNPRVKKLQSDYDAVKRELSQVGGIDNGSKPLIQSDSADIENKHKAIDDTLEYTEKLREYRSKEVAYRALLQELKEAKVTEENCPFIIQALGNPTIPNKKTKPQRKRTIFMAGIAGFILGILLTLFRRYLEFCKQDAEIAEQIEYIKSYFSISKKGKRQRK